MNFGDTIRISALLLAAGCQTVVAVRGTATATIEAGFPTPVADVAVTVAQDSCDGPKLAAASTAPDGSYSVEFPSSANAIAVEFVKLDFETACTMARRVDCPGSKKCFVADGALHKPRSDSD